MADRVPMQDLGRSWLSEDETAAIVARIVRSGWYVLGPEVAAFERELAEFLGVDYGIGVASGTDAIALALQGVGCRPGDLVATVANAGGYAAVAARSIGAVPVFVDIDPESLTMSAESLGHVLGRVRPRAVVVTHLYGNPVSRSVFDLCRTRGIDVVEDCAQAIGATVDGRPVGAHGKAAAFSFYPTKNLGGLGDGGAVVTSHAEVDRRVRRLRQYGWTSRYQIGEPRGRNSRLDEVQAAVLRRGLQEVSSWAQRRREIVKRYHEALRGGDFRCATRPDEASVAHLSVVVAPSRAARDSALNELSAAGISTDIHYPIPDFRQPGLVADVGEILEPWVPMDTTAQACATVFSVPLFPGLKNREIGRVCESLSSLSKVKR